MFKYELGQEVWYIENNIIHSASILSRKYVDNAQTACTNEQREVFEQFGESILKYSTIDGEFLENEIFESKEELVTFLLSEVTKT